MPGNSRDIRLPLKKYSPPTSGHPNPDDTFFVGRREILKKLSDTLITMDNRQQRRSFLVTGYRGSGKTRFVNKIVYEYKNRIYTQNNPFNRIPAVIKWPRKKEEVSPNNQSSTAKGENSTGQKRQPETHGIAESSPIENNLTEKMDYAKQINAFAVYMNLGSSKNLDINPIMFDMARNLMFAMKGRYKYYKTLLSLSWIGLFGAVLFLYLWNSYLLLTAPGFISYFLLVVPLSLFGVCSLVLLDFFRSNFNKACKESGSIARIALFRELETLIEDIDYSVSTSAKSAYQGNGFSIGFGKNKTRKAITERECESRMIRILDLCKWARYRVIYVFDELDKISLGENTASSGSEEIKQRKGEIDLVLAGLKNMISHGHAFFFFIAGRELFDTYHAEISSTGNLYENLFDEIINIPSLLKDFSDNKKAYFDSMIEKFVIMKLKGLSCEGAESDNNVSLASYSKDSDDIDKAVFIRSFVQYLTLRSWGNFKRLILLFHDFVKSNGQNEVPSYELVFTIEDQQRIMLGGFLYRMLYQNLQEKLIRGDDKLAVSTFAIYDHILKFHNHAFSRHQLERGAMVLSIHSSPQISEIIDSIINKVLSPYIRHIRYGLHELRFSILLSNELNYAAYISPVESAAYNFSLGSNNDVKLYYHEQLSFHDQAKNVDYNHNGGSAKYCLILGDLYRWERKYDKALYFYGRAIAEMSRIEKSNRYNELLSNLVYAFIVSGHIHEVMSSFKSALSYYNSAINTIYDAYYHQSSAADNAIEPIFFDNVSFDTLNPSSYLTELYFLARLSGEYVKKKCFSSDKISSGPYSDSPAISVLESKYLSSPLNLFRLATLAFYNNNLAESKDYFIEVRRKLYDALNKYGDIHQIQDNNAVPLDFIRTKSVSMREAFLYGQSLVRVSELRIVCHIADRFDSLPRIEGIIDSSRIMRELVELKKLCQECFPDMLHGAKILWEKGHKTRAIYGLLSILNLKIAVIEFLPADYFYMFGRYPRSILLNKIISVVKEFSAEFNLINHLLFDWLRILEKGHNHQHLGRLYYNDIVSSSQNTSSQDAIADFDPVSQLMDYWTKPDPLHLDGKSYESLVSNISPLSQLCFAYVRWASGGKDVNIRCLENSCLFSVRARLYELFFEAQSKYASGDLNFLVTFEDIRSRSYSSADKEIEWDKIKSIAQAYFDLIMAIERFADNDTHVITPPIFLAHYGLWRVLIRSIATCMLKKGGGTYRQAANKVFRELSKDAGANSEYKSRFDVEFCRAKVKKAFQDQLIFRNRFGNTQGNVFSSKYFINDDFEDPLFFMETVFHKFMAGSIEIYEEFVDRCHQNLLDFSNETSYPVMEPIS